MTIRRKIKGRKFLNDLTKPGHDTKEGKRGEGKPKKWRIFKEITPS